MHRESNIIAYGILRALGIVAAILILLYLIYELQALITFIVLAAVISLLGRPIVNFLKEKANFGDTSAAIATIILVILIIFGIFALFVPIIIDQSTNISQIDFVEFEHSLKTLNIEVSRSLGVDQLTLIEGLRQSEFMTNFDISFIPVFLKGLLGNLSSLVVGTLSVIFISFFFLKDSHLLLDSFLVFAQRGDESKFKRVFDKTKELLSRYFIGIFLQLLILFIIYAILLFSFQIPNALAIALFCALLNIVPYLGPVIGFVIMNLLVISGYITADFDTVILPKLIYVSTGYAIAQLIDNFINQPLIFGSSVRSHPLEIFLAILVAGFLFGILGMITAVPVYTAIKVIAKEFFAEYKIVQKLTKNL